MVCNRCSRLHIIWNNFLFLYEQYYFKPRIETVKKEYGTEQIMTVAEKIGLYASICIIVILLCLIVFSKYGVLDYNMLKGKEQALSDQILTIDMENQKFENELRSLKTDMNYLKHLAKQEHDMAEEEELIFKDDSYNKGKTP